MLSDHFADMIDGMTKFNNPIVFDFSKTNKTRTKRAYPKKVIKYFLDCIHLQVGFYFSTVLIFPGQETEELNLLELLLLLDFLTSEGRQDSEFEQDMAKRLCDDLKKAKLDIVTNLMIVLFMTHFDSDDLGYADFVCQDRVKVIFELFFV